MPMTDLSHINYVYIMGVERKSLELDETDRKFEREINCLTLIKSFMDEYKQKMTTCCALEKFETSKSDRPSAPNSGKMKAERSKF